MTALLDVLSDHADEAVLEFNTVNIIYVQFFPIVKRKS